ncbi:MAG TPA: DUF3309 family protein [Candidatus Tectomicrobia bacterium]
MGLILLLILIFLLFGGLPQISGNWHSYGYAPSGIVVVLVVIVAVLLLSGRL